MAKQTSTTVAPSPARRGRAAALPAVVVGQPTGPKRPAPAVAAPTPAVAAPKGSKRVTPGAPPQNGAAALVAPAPRGPAPKAPPMPSVAATLSADVQAQINAMKAQIVKLTGQLSKATARNGSSLTSDEAQKEGAELPDTDWRKQYCGWIGYVKAFRYGKGDELQLTGKKARVMLALPQEADKGGANAHTQGQLAVFDTSDRSGKTWTNPTYIYEEEISDVWIFETEG
jgi:hypothetical protein